MIPTGRFRPSRWSTKRLLPGLVAAAVSLLPNALQAQPQVVTRLTAETWNEAAWAPILGSRGDTVNVSWAQTLRTAVVHFSKNTAELPEADDEQQLAKPCGTDGCDPTEYVNVIATIFPTDVLGKWTTIDFENAGRDGIPVAEICSTEAYAPLALEKTVPTTGKCENPNALFIALLNGKWSALMVSLSSAGIVKRPLDVDRATFETDKLCTDKQGNCETDVPPVARFDWIRKHVTISVRCGEGWCDVLPYDEGAKDGKAEKPEHADSSRNVRVKGWHDRQRLMIREQNQQKPLGPTLTVAPNDALAKIKLTDFNNTWRTVAYINRPKDYKEITDNAGNKVPLIRGGQYKRNDIQIMTTDPNDPTKWLWRMVYVKNNGAEEISNWTRPVKRTGHQMLPVPATARWRWKVDDEGIWVRCANGCCELQF